MGRMSDLWKTSPRPLVAAATPVLELVPGPVEESHDWFGGSGSVPFVEVGGPPEPAIRLMTPPGLEPEPEPMIKLAPAPLPPGVFSVQFRPVMPGAVPGRGFGPELVTYHDPGHPISEQYRRLLGELVLQLTAGSPRVLLFTGGMPEAGTTTVLLNLAVTIAKTEAARVTVVDANWPRPAIGEKLGLSTGPGLREVLTGRTPLPWAIQNTRLDGLQAIFAGRSTLMPVESGLPPIIERLRQESDWVLIDAPSWSDPNEGKPLAECCDAVYLVFRQPDADTPAALDVQRGIADATGRLKGCVLTQR